MKGGQVLEGTQGVHNTERKARMERNEDPVGYSLPGMHAVFVAALCLAAILADRQVLENCSSVLPPA